MPLGDTSCRRIWECYVGSRSKSNWEKCLWIQKNSPFMWVAGVHSDLDEQSWSLQDFRFFSLNLESLFTNVLCYVILLMVVRHKQKPNNHPNCHSPRSIPPLPLTPPVECKAISVWTICLEMIKASDQLGCGLEGCWFLGQCFNRSPSMWLLSDSPTVHHGQITQKQSGAGLTPTIITWMNIVQSTHTP